MFVKVNCQFCRQPFDFDSSSGLPQIDCPHCGKQNVVDLPAQKPEMTIQHGAPNLSGAKPCPSCRHQVARDASLCVHCGYNFVTGKKAGEKGWLASNLGFVLLLAGMAIAAVLGGLYLLRPQEAPLPPPPDEPVASVSAEAPAPPAPSSNQPPPPSLRPNRPPRRNRHRPPPRRRNSPRGKPRPSAPLSPPKRPKPNGTCACNSHPASRRTNSMKTSSCGARTG